MRSKPRFPKEIDELPLINLLEDFNVNYSIGNTKYSEILKLFLLVKGFKLVIGKEVLIVIRNKSSCLFVRTANKLHLECSEGNEILNSLFVKWKEL